jgi:micrococcal nuclease
VYEYHATLLAVVDGDTFHVRIDLGLDIGINTTLRLVGINAPELKTAEGQRSKQWASDWLAQHAPTGPLRINTVKDKREKYGRYLARVTAPDGAVFNDDILAAHMAVPYMVS